MGRAWIACILKNTHTQMANHTERKLNWFASIHLHGFVLQTGAIPVKLCSKQLAVTLRRPISLRNHVCWRISRMEYTQTLYWKHPNRAIVRYCLHQKTLTFSIFSTKVNWHWYYCLFGMTKNASLAFLIKDIHYCVMFCCGYSINSFSINATHLHIPDKVASLVK